MSAESNQGLVRITFREILQELGDLMDMTIGTKDSGLIPLEVSLEDIKIRADEIGLVVNEPMKDAEPGVFSRVFVIGKTADDNINNSALLIEFEGCLWVHNGGFDDFRELMGLAK